MGDGGLWHPALTRWADEVERFWAAGGVPADVRRGLRLDLVTDLARARADGASVDELTSTPPAQFAADVAAAAGVDLPATPALDAPGAPLGGRQPSSEWARIIGAGLGGTAAGALASVLAVYPAGFWFSDTALSTFPDPWPFTLLVHLVALGTTLAAAYVAVRFALRGTPRGARAALTTTASLAIAGLGAFVSVWASTQVAGEPTRMSDLVALIVVVALWLLGGLVTASFLAGRRYRAGPAFAPLGLPG